MKRFNPLHKDFLSPFGAVILLVWWVPIYFIKTLPVGETSPFNWWLLGGVTSLYVVVYAIAYDWSSGFGWRGWE